MVSVVPSSVEVCDEPDGEALDPQPAIAVLTARTAAVTTANSFVLELGFAGLDWVELDWVEIDWVEIDTGRRERDAVALMIPPKGCPLAGIARRGCPFSLVPVAPREPADSGGRQRHCCGPPWIRMQIQRSSNM
jgi:hypothetical protein